MMDRSDDIMLAKMWKYLMKSNVMLDHVPETVPRDVPRPELHCCPSCGAGISRLWLYQGGIVGRGSRATVRASILCHQCKKQHSLQGDTPYHRGVVLILLSHPRKKPGQRMAMFRTGAMA